MRFASRRREVPYYVAWFAARGYDVLDLSLSGDDFLEGHGDLLHHPGARRVWAGYGIRSSLGAVTRFTNAMAGENIDVEPLELIDETFYHLDTCLAPLGADAALYYPGAFAPGARAALQHRWTRLHEADRAEAERFACNGIAVNGVFIASQLSQRLQAVVRDEGLQPVTVDLSEFEKAGGSAFCLKNFLV
jgi:N-dimethylarginine dimethylaminohydrolase